MGSPLLLTVPNLDITQIANYQPWENNFQFTWDAPTVDLDSWQAIFLAAQEIKQQVEFLKNQVMAHYQELETLNFRSGQSKKFGEFAIQWLLHLDKGVQELRTATSQAFGEVNKSVLQLSEGINLTRLNVQQNSETISTQSTHTQLALEEIYGKFNGLEKAWEQTRHTQDTLTSQLKKMAVGMENTFGEIGKELKVVAQEVTKINQKIDSVEKKIQGLGKGLEEQGQTNKAEITNIVDNQNQWGAYFEDKITGLNMNDHDLNYRLAQIEEWVNAQIFAQQQGVPQVPPQQPQNWYGQGGGNTPNYGEMPPNEGHQQPPQEENWDERFNQALRQGSQNSEPNSHPPSANQEQGRGEDDSNVSTPGVEIVENPRGPARVQVSQENNARVPGLNLSGIILEEEANREIFILS